jgi:DNA damage-inducible protein 1
VNNPEAEDQDLRLVTLDVFPEMTLGALRSSIEAEGIPAPSQHLYHNGKLITDDSKTLQELSITDGEMLALHIRDMRGNTGIPQAPREQHHPSRRSGASGAQQDPESLRQQILREPELRAQVQRTNAPLAAALDNPQLFSQVYRQTQNQQEEARLARLARIAHLEQDPFNPEYQAEIQEMIRQQTVMENLQNAMEHNPEGKLDMSFVLPCPVTEADSIPQLLVVCTCCTSTSRSTATRLRLL